MPFLPISPGGGKVTVTKSLTAAPGAPAAIRPLVVIGYASDDTGLPVATPTPFVSPGAIQEAGGTGPLVEQVAFDLSPYGGVQTVHAINTGAANAGAYGSITENFANAAPPTVAGDGTIKPDDSFEVIVRFPTGGTVGAAGIVYDFSLDGGYSYFAPRDLGTATAIELPYGAGKYDLVAPETELVALVNDLRTQLLAHFALTAGGVHGAADATSGVGIGSAASSVATAITLVNQLRTAYEAHRVLTAGSVHGAADSTNVVSAPAATDSQTAVTLANELKADYEAHRVLTAGSVHGAADSTNDVTAANAVRGVIEDDDSFSLETTEPTPDATQLQTAIRSLRDYPFDFGAIQFVAPVTGALVDTITTELQSLWAYAKFKDFVASFRPPNTGETVVQYKAALKASLDGHSTTEGRVCSGGVRVYSALMTAAGGQVRPLRPNGWWVGAARATSQPQTYLAFLPAAPGVFIKDSGGQPLARCFDEQSGQLYSVETRTCGTRSDPQKANGTLGVFLTQDLLLYSPDSPWVLGPYASVVNHLVESAQYFLKESSQTPNGYPAPPGEALPDEIRKMLESGGQAIVDSEGVGKGRNSQALLQLEATAGLDGALPWKLTVVPNNYPINGATLKVSLSAVSLNRSATTTIGG